MNDRAINVDRVFDLAGAICDDCASENDCAELDSIVVADETSGRRYWDYCRMHVMLGMEARVHQALQKVRERDNLDLAALTPWECDALLAALPPAASPVSSPVLGFLSTTLPRAVGFLSSDWPVAYLIATVMFGMGLVIGSLVPVSEPEQVARQSAPLPAPLSPLPTMVGQVTGMVDCRFDRRSEISDPRTQDPRPKTLVHLGDKFALASGLMEITYDTGARVILQGPITYEVESAAGGFLSAGKLTARLEKRGERRGERGEGATNHQISNPKSQIANPSPLSPLPSPLFVVRTPTAVVTDLGTEFGVEVGKEGRTEVHVLQGLVEARPSGIRGITLPAQRVTEGCAVEIAPKADQFKLIAFAPRSFVRTLQPPTETPSETAYINAVLADKPMGYWPLNEPPHSRTFRDRSGNGIHGYAMNKVMAGQPGPLGDGSRAVALNGNEYIDFGRRDQFAMKNDFTVEAWVWIGDVEWSSHIISVLGADDKYIRENDGSRYIGWSLIAGRRRPDSKSDVTNPVVLSFNTHGGGNTVYFSLSRGELIEARWVHVAVVFDRANTAHLYLNGEHRGSVAKHHSVYVGPVWLQIGTAEIVDADFYRGRLAHIAVYPRALGAQQIQNHYSQRNGGKQSPRTISSHADRKETP